VGRESGALVAGAPTTQANRQLHVLWENSDPFSMDSAEVGVFEDFDQEGLHKKV